MEHEDVENRSRLGSVKVRDEDHKQENGDRNER